jgi:eukaryotic-like serine/threonine-protein kinase
MAAPQNKSQVPVGTVLEGKFRITREIGRGGMAAVYEAENIVVGKRVAVKILAAELITSRIVRERFIREARAAAAIRSPNICDVYDSGMFDGRPFLVMELLEGESLYDMMTRVRRLDADTTLAVMTQTARGLGKAHEASVIHRDLKPENIFITKTPEGDLVVKLLDFGLAKFYEQTNDQAQHRLTREGALFGTPAYMSPEQAKGQGEVDHRADLWALGCIVYECLTGTTVWNVDQGVAMILAQIAGAPIPKPSKLRPDLPPGFDAWFAKALERDPEKRFQTAKEFAEALAIGLKAATSVAPPVWRQSSAPSAEESALVDQLMIASPPSATPAAAAQESRGSRTAEIPPDQVVPVQPAPPASPWRAVSSLLALAVVALGGYAVWLYLLHPPNPVASNPGLTAPPSASSAAEPAASAPDYSKPLETEGFAKKISQAQALLRDGKRDESLSAFKDAFNQGGSGVARGLLNHAAVVVPNSDGKCKATGLGRPRPFDRVTPTSRPTVVSSKSGTVIAWVDNDQDAARRQAFTVLVDDALRRVSPARLVTPEATSVRMPQLRSVGDAMVLVYWDDGGNEPGVFARLLESDGRIAGPARRISAPKRHEFYPSLARGEDGTFWAVWEESTEDGSDLMGRHLSAELEPQGKPIRLTAFAIGRDGHGTTSGRPVVAVIEGQLNVAFVLERDNKRRIMMLEAPPTDPGLGTGVTRANPAPGKKRGDDRFVGKLFAISNADGKQNDPRISCDKEGCFLAWDDDKGGALAAFVDRKKGQAIWHREFARSGSSPELTAAPGGAAMVYYEGSRLKLSLMTRDGVEAGSVIAKVGGTQPFPSIAPGTKPGQWYISWRDYESGHFETYVVRAQCQ